jgi:cyanophycinase
LVQLAGGKGAKFVVFPTAAGDPARSAQLIVDALNKYGADAETIPVSANWKGRNVSDDVRDPALIAKVKAARGVYFAGGAQDRITTALFESDGKRTPMLQAIWDVFDAGGVVAGSSAGAAIMSATMFRDPPSVINVLQSDKLRVGSDLDRGLGFVGSEIFVDQHFLKRGRIGRLLPAMVQTGFKWGLGVEENAAAIVHQGKIEVVGAPGGKGALLVDLRDAATNPAIGAFNLRNARLSYLDSGDRFELASATAITSTKRATGNKLDADAPGFKPYHQSVPFYPDMLGDGVIVNAMSTLLDSTANEVRGLAFAPPSGSKTRPSAAKTKDTLGFEFRLYKTKQTTGYFSSAGGGEDYSVFYMGLDVTPVQMAKPLYRQLTGRPEANPETGVAAKPAPAPAPVQK